MLPSEIGNDVGKQGRPHIYDADWIVPTLEATQISKPSKETKPQVTSKCKFFSKEKPIWKFSIDPARRYERDCRRRFRGLYIPALLQKLASEYFDFIFGSLRGNLAGILRDFFGTTK